MTSKSLLFLSFFVFCLSFAQKTHTVSSGENPYGISKKYGISLSELYRLNPSIENTPLSIGQVLQISKNASNNQKIGQIVIQPKQTLYGITKQYRISLEDLQKLNPGIDENLKIGDRVNLPMNSIVKYGDYSQIETEEILPESPKEQTIEPVQPKNAPTYSTTTLSNDYLNYTVQSGDTIFGIVNKFDISIDELIRLNPALERGLNPGMVIKLKKLDAAYIKKNDNALNVVLMLPFGYESGSTKYRTMSMEFLSGARLAIERNVRKGQRLDVKIIDAGSEETFKNSLTQLNRENTDVIIGPFFKRSVLDVLDFVKEQKIPVVAPFANSDDLYDYSNLIIVATKDEVFANRIINDVKSNYNGQKIYIVGGTDQKYANLIKSGLQESLKNADIEIVNHADQINLVTNMMTGQSAPIISILATDNDAEGEAFANRMVQLSESTGENRAYSMYYFPIFDRKVEQLTKANLVYIMDLKINVDGDFEKEVMSDFEGKYCKKPSRFSVIGFDIMNDILTRENSKGELLKSIDKTQTQLGTKFQYVRSKTNGAYVNTGYRVVSLLP